jgi:glycine/sarcosine N-methyltransferase
VNNRFYDELARFRVGGIVLFSLRNYGPMIAQRASSTPPSPYLDGKLRRVVHQVWDWQDDRRYVAHSIHHDPGA